MPGFFGFYSFGEGREHWETNHFIYYGLTFNSQGLVDEVFKDTSSPCIPFVKLTNNWGTFHRSDIGSPELLAKRMDMAERARTCCEEGRLATPIVDKENREV